MNLRYPNIFTSINRFLSGHMLIVIFGGIGLGYFIPALIVLKPFVSLMFGYMTFITALGISLSDMGGVMRKPAYLFLLFFLQHVVMPLIALSAATFFLGRDSLFTVGIVLSVVIPVGVVSIIWTGITGGAVPLALTTVAIGSVLSPFIVPFSISLLFGTSIRFDTLEMMKGLTLMIVLPTIAGISLHEFSRGNFGKRSAGLNGTLSKAALSLVVAVNVAAARSIVNDLNLALAPVMVLLAFQAAGGYLLGFLAGIVFRFPESVRTTFLFCSGMRNISAGIVIALQYFRPETAVPVVLAMLFQQPLATLVGRLVMRRGRNSSERKDAVPDDIGDEKIPENSPPNGGDEAVADRPGESVPGPGRRPGPREIVLVIAPVNGGKTTFVRELAGEKRAEGLTVCGVISVAETRGEEKVAYSFVDITSGMEAGYAVLNAERTGSGYPRFSFLEEGFLFADAVLTGALDADVLIVDEAGPVELGGGGLMKTLKYLVSCFPGVLVITVRDRLVRDLEKALGAAGTPVRVVRVERNAGTGA